MKNEAIAKIDLGHSKANTSRNSKWHVTLMITSPIQYSAIKDHSQDLPCS